MSGYSTANDQGVHTSFQMVPKTGDGTDDSEHMANVSSQCGGHVICCSSDPDHRRLAISSIICGLTCLGIVSLIYSVKAQEKRRMMRDSEDVKRRRQRDVEAQVYSDRACKYGVGAIVAWLILLILTPLLIVFTSYLLTLID